MNPVEVEVEVTRLRDLDLKGLQARWRVLMGRLAPTQLPRHLLVRILAYRVQADAFGDLLSAGSASWERRVARRRGPE